MATSSIFLELDSKEPAGALVSGSTLKANYVGLQLLPPTVADAATQIAGMSEDIRKLSQQLRQSNVISDLDRAIKNADDQASKFGKVMDSAQSLLGDQKMRDNLQAAIASIRHTTEQTDHIAGKLDALSDSLKNTSDTAGVTLKDAQQHMDLLSKQVGDRLTQIAGLLASVQNITEKLTRAREPPASCSTIHVSMKRCSTAPSSSARPSANCGYSSSNGNRKAWDSS